MLLGDMVALAESIEPREPSSADVDDGSLHDVEDVRKSIVHMIIVSRMHEPAGESRRIAVGFADEVAILRSNITVMALFVEQIAGCAGLFVEGTGENGLEFVDDFRQLYEMGNFRRML